MLLVIAIAGLLGLRYAKKMVSDFTEAQPTPMPAVRLSMEEAKSVRKRVDAFREAVRIKEPATPLALTVDEINALMATESDLRSFKGRVSVTAIEPGQFKGAISVPVEDLGLPAFRGRYLNGSATLKVAFRNGVLLLTAQDILIKGRPLPEVYMQKIRAQNLAKDLNNDSRGAAAMDALQDIQLKDGEVIITPKRTPNSQQK